MLHLWRRAQTEQAGVEPASGVSSHIWESNMSKHSVLIFSSVYTQKRTRSNYMTATPLSGYLMWSFSELFKCIMLSSQVTCRRINTTLAVPLNSVVPYSVFDLHYFCCYGRSQVLQSKTQLVEVIFPLFINDVFLREKTNTYFR